ncbi:MAG: hypothetical protein AB1485_06390 [Candidatus Thermoplasmatota archaeon]
METRSFLALIAGILLVAFFGASLAYRLNYIGDYYFGIILYVTFILIGILLIAKALSRRF